MTVIHKLTRLRGVADQFSIVAAVSHEDEPISHVEFVGNVHGSPGPIVMLTGKLTETRPQVFVTDPARFGTEFNEAWVERFFA